MIRTPNLYCASGSRKPTQTWKSHGWPRKPRIIFEYGRLSGFHCQQAVEKYLKALLTYHQIEFPKTHQIQRLLVLVSGVDREAADALAGAKWLGPFGVEIRYPGDTAEMLAGDEVKAIEIASQAKQVVLAILNTA